MERWEIFSFVLEIYNPYFNVVVLLMNLFGINFDFSIFKEWVNEFGL